MEKENVKLKDLLPYTVISKLMAVSEKMLQRYDNDGSVSDRNRIKLNDFKNKYLNDEDFKKSVNGIANRDEPTATIKEVEKPVIPKPADDILNEALQMISILVTSVGVISNELRELTNTTMDLAEVVLAASPASLNTEITLKLDTQASTLSRMDDDLRNVMHSLKQLQASQNPKLETSPPKTIIPNKNIEIQNTSIIDKTELIEDDDELYDLLNS